MPTDPTTPRKPGLAFCWGAICLLLAAIVVAFVQKRAESAAAAAQARRVADGASTTDENGTDVVLRDIQHAAACETLSFAAVLLAIALWAVAIARHENRRWASACIVVLLSAYAMIERLMV
jgi:sterol desaturase/sphingolipid hydroxylase (fatty acid hydroxylase superfamily)